MNKINKNCGIYKITSPSGRIYIGQSKELRQRISNYKKMYKSNLRQRGLHNSFKKYGVENHQFDIVEYCSEEELNCSERFWQDEFDVIGENGLNCILTQCGDKRYKVSKETSERLTNKQIGEKNHMYGRTGDRHHNYGKTLSKETKKLISESKKGKYTGELSARSNIILDTQTGVFYFGIKEASKSVNLKYSTLNSLLKGINKNKTSLIYV